MDVAKAALILMCLVLAGCATSPGGVLPCNVGPIVLDEDDELTQGTQRQIVALNNTGANPRVCNWQPPSGGVQ